MSHGKKKFILALQPNGRSRLKRSTDRTRLDRVAAILYYDNKKPIGRTYHYRRNADGRKYMVWGGCPACRALNGHPYECDHCAWLSSVQMRDYPQEGVPRSFRKPYEASYRQYERTMARRLVEAYRAGETQEDDGENLEYERIIRDAGWDYF